MGIFDFTQAASDPNNPNSIVAPSEVARRQMLADEMMKQGADYSPVQSPWQGAARLAQGLFGGMQSARDRQLTQAGQADNTRLAGPALAALLRGFGADNTGAATGASATPQPANTGAPGQINQTPIADPMAGYRNSIYKMESSNNYQALGPVTANGDRAYGAGQVMGNNIAPWTAAALGHALTQDQFLADPKAQDAVFAKQFGSYLQNGNSPQDAASMWFTGKPLNQGGSAAQDILGTTGNQYAAKFTAGLPGAPNGAQSPAPGGQPNPTMTANAMAPAPASGAPQMSPASGPPPQAISVPGYDGQFTQGQAVDGDGSPSQAEWAAAAKGGGQPQVQPASAPTGQQGANSNAPVATMSNGMPLGMNDIMAYLNHPYTSPAMAQVFSHMLESQMAQNTPLAQAQLTRAQSDAQNAGLGAGYTRGPDGKATFIPGGPADPSTIQTTTKAGEGNHILTAGGQLVGPDGKTLASNDSGSMDDTTAMSIAHRVYLGDPTAMVGLGRGSQGAANIAKIQGMVAQLSKDNQGQPKPSFPESDVIKNKGDYAFGQSEAKAAGGLDAKMSAYGAETQASAKIALDASAAVGRGSFVPMNQLMQMYQRNTSDPDLARFNASINSLVGAYAKARNPTGTPTDSDRGHAMDMLSSATSKEAFSAAVNQLQQEVYQGQSAIRQSREDNRNGTPLVAPPTYTSPNAAQPAAAIPAIGEVRRGFKFKGGSPSQQSSWEAVQ